MLSKRASIGVFPGGFKHDGRAVRGIDLDQTKKIARMVLLYGRSFRRSDQLNMFVEQGMISPED